MIKAQELRVGSLFYSIDRTGEVHLPVELPYKVAEYYLGAVRGYRLDEIITGEVTLKLFKISDISPIPLTEEWLERFGFEKREGSVGDSFYIGINPVTKDWMFDIVWLKNMMDYSYEDFPFYRNGHFRIQYVHTLQNLFFSLTGQELELKQGKEHPNA